MQRIIITEQENNAELRMQVGDVLVVRLEASPGAGYSWNMIGREGSVLRLRDEPTFERVGEQRLGGVEQQVFSFRAQSAGVHTLRLEYRRPWEKQGPAAKTFSIHIIAAE